MQDEDPPCLPERNGLEAVQLQPQQQRPMNNVATQKLHEILTTPRKPRSRSQGDTLSPVKSPQQHHQQPGVHGLQRRGSFTPGCSPSSSATGKRIDLRFTLCFSWLNARDCLRENVVVSVRVMRHCFARGHYSLAIIGLCGTDVFCLELFQALSICSFKNRDKKDGYLTKVLPGKFYSCHYLVLPL